jgi:hypothetical protein
MIRFCFGWSLALTATLIITSALIGGVNRSIEKPDKKQQKETPAYFPQSIEKDIDILFVEGGSQPLFSAHQNCPPSCSPELTPLNWSDSDLVSDK